MKTPLCPYCGRRMRVNKMDAAYSTLDAPKIVWYVWHECSAESKVGCRIVEYCGPTRSTREKAIEHARRQIRKSATKCLVDMTA